MSRDYGNTEKRLAQLLSKFPGLKHGIKKIYQKINYYIYSKKYKHLTELIINEYNFENKETFFGYYDHSPLNPKQTHILFHASTLSTKKLPDPDYPIDIVLFSLKDNTAIKIAESSAYNWQQGSRLQWINDEEFIFNSFNKQNDSYQGNIVNINAPHKTQTIKYPVYDVRENIALSLNFDRLNLLRPDYGYRNNPLLSPDQLNDATDGIFYLNLENNTKKLLFSIESLKRIDPVPEFNKALHKVNHIMLAPNGDHFIFMHRWIINGRRFDRLLLSNINGTDIRIIGSGIVSHCCWINDNKIMGYFTHQNSQPHFHLVTITNEAHSIETPGILKNMGDGHPNCINNRIVFDTYPDKSRMKSLFVYDLNKENIDKIGEFYESMRYYDQTRCDLHPRFGLQENRIFIDSVHTGLRKLYSLVYE